MRIESDDWMRSSCSDVTDVPVYLILHGEPVSMCKSRYWHFPYVHHRIKVRRGISCIEPYQ